MASRELKVEITGDSSSLEKALGRSGREAETFGTKVRKASLLAGAALGAGLAVAGKIGFDELRQGQEVSAQTAAALKSTGDAANVTQKHIEDLATSLSRMSGVDDELIQSSENVLLAFTGVRNEVGKGNDIFDRATRVVLDYSARTGKDAAGAARIFGKALQDPLKYTSSLARAGVVLTNQQKAQIKAFEEGGKPLEAQKVLLKALEERYGGAAKAAGDTLTGQLNKATEAFREMAAGVVVVLLPALTTLAKIITQVAQYFQDHSTQARILTAALVALAATLVTVGIATKLYAAYQAIAKAATVAWTAAQWLLNAALTANPIGIVVVALAALVAGLILAWKNSETFRRIVTAAFDAVKVAATFVLNFFRDNWKTIAVLISGPFAPLVALATNAFGIRSALVGAAEAIIGFFRNNWKTIAVLISGPFAPLVALATNAFGIRSALVGAFEGMKNAVSEKVGALVAVVKGIPGEILDALGNLSHLLYNAGVQIIQGLINGITDKLGDLWHLVGGIGGRIASLKGPIEKDRVLLFPHGRALIEGLQAGMESRLPDLEKMTMGIGDRVATQILGAGRLIGQAVGAGVTGNMSWTADQVLAAGGGYSAPASMAMGASSEAVAEVTVPIYLDSTQIAEVVRREYLRFEKRNGRSAL